MIIDNVKLLIDRMGGVWAGRLETVESGLEGGEGEELIIDNVKLIIETMAGVWAGRFRLARGDRFV